jgi:phage protein D
VKGAAVAFEFGVNTQDTFKSGKGYRIDTIDVTGGATGDTVTWTATGQLPSAALHTRQSNAWSNTTLDGVAKAISDKHGLDLVFECKDNIKLFRLDQTDESDLALIKRLTKQYGLTCSIKGGKEKPTLVITDLDIMSSKTPAFTINRKDCISFNFKDKAGLNTKGRYTRYFDPQQKKLIEFTHDRQSSSVKDGLTEGTLETLEGKGQQDKAIVREAMDVHATRVAKAPEATERKATLTLPGNTSLLSGVVVDLLEDDWLKNAGVWVITVSEHKLSVANGYTTTLTMEKQV